MYHIQNTVPINHRIQQAQSISIFSSAAGHNGDETSPEHKTSSLRSTKIIDFLSLFTKQEHALWYRGVFGTMTLRKNSKYTKSPGPRAGRKTRLFSKTAWTFRPSFINYTVQLCYARSFSHVSRSLNIYPVLSGADPVFEICQIGDLLDLQVTLSEKGISPFVTDYSGLTLLHVSIDRRVLPNPD